MIKHPFIEWNSRLMLGIPLIDSQHQKLIQLTKNLHIACLQNPEIANSYFIEVAHQAIDYVYHHFSTEEKIMLLLKYPEYSEHKKEHQNFVREILIENQKFSVQKHLVPNRYVQYLKNWILSHIAVSDKTLAEYIQCLKYQKKLQRLVPGMAGSR